MRLALFQADGAAGDALGDKALQLAALARTLRALKGHADLLVTPELFMTGYRLPPPVLQRLAEPADGDFAGAVATLARETGIAVLYGFAERDGAHVFNAVMAVDSHGRKLAVYRKLHLPSDDERAAFTAGERIVTFELHGFRIAPLICYDIEFPESVRACVDAGVDLVLAPTALRQHWAQIAESVIPVRARENGAFVAYCNFAGVEADWHYAGLSSICAPDGRVLAKAGAAADLIVAELDRAGIAAARARLSYLADRRFQVTGPMSVSVSVGKSVT